MANNLPATQPKKDPAAIAKKAGVSVEVANLLTPIQLGWLKLANDKTTTFDKLVEEEWAVQGKLVEIEKEQDLEKVQLRIKEAKAIAETSKARRLAFTGMLQEKIIAPAMEYEKRNDELIKKAGTHEFSLRKAAEKKEAETKDKLREEAALRAHCMNEKIRIGSEYKTELAKLVTNAYTEALKGPIPPDEIPEYLEKIRGFIRETKLSKFVRFERTIEGYSEKKDKKGNAIPIYKYVDDTKAKEIFKSVGDYDPTEDLQNALTSLDKSFEMYDHDFKNKKAAIKAAQERQSVLENEIAEEAEQSIATNNLMKQVDTYSISASGGAKTKISRKYQIDIENTQEWALNVISAFLANWGKVAPLIKAKTWEKVSLGQMGKALADLKTLDNETKFEVNLKFTQIEK